MILVQEKKKEEVLVGETKKRLIKERQRQCECVKLQRLLWDLTHNTHLLDRSNTLEHGGGKGQIWKVDSQRHKRSKGNALLSDLVYFYWLRKWCCIITSLNLLSRWFFTVQLREINHSLWVHVCDLFWSFISWEFTVIYSMQSDG